MWFCGGLCGGVRCSSRGERLFGVIEVGWREKLVGGFICVGVGEGSAYPLGKSSRG